MTIDWLGLGQRRVLVAGAGGIGVACAAAFRDVGARVAVADISAERLSTLDDAVMALADDLSTTEGCERAVQETVRAFGGLDVLVHAVGTTHRVPVLDVDDEVWRRIIEVNLTSAFRLGRAAGRVMVEAGHGRQIYCSSVSGLLAHPDHAPYAASKGGLDQLVRVMARVGGLRSHGQCYRAGLHRDRPHPGAPGPAGRARALHLPGAGRAPRGSRGPHRPVLFLASDKASFVTGHIMCVDGGRNVV